MNCPACVTLMNNLAHPHRAPFWSCPECGLSGTADQLDQRRRSRVLVLECVDEHKGVTTLQRNPSLPSAYQRFDTTICQHCTCAGHIRETVAPTDTHTGYYQCDSCGWTGPGKALRPGQTQKEADRAITVDRWGTKVDKQASDSLAQDRRRGKKGGGGSKSGKAGKKQGSKTRFRHDREEVVWSNLRAAHERNTVIKVPGLVRPVEDLRDAIARYLEDKRREASGE